eukprot:scaffold43830_cov69-Phaeocystis_antarctica.AAC.4
MLGRSLATPRHIATTHACDGPPHRLPAVARPLAHGERVPRRVACHRLGVPPPPQLGPVALEVALQESELLVAERLPTLTVARRTMLRQPQQQGLAVDGDERRQPHGLQRAIGVRHHVTPQ